MSFAIESIERKGAEKKKKKKIKIRFYQDLFSRVKNEIKNYNKAPPHDDFDLC